MSKPSDPITRLIAKTPGWRGATLAQLRKVIHEADPEITEAVKWRRPSAPMGAPVWEHDGIVCIGNVLKERVRLTMPAGASLPDPHGLFNARLDSDKVRAIDIFEGDKPSRTALRGLIKSGVEYNLTKTKRLKATKK